MDVVATRLTEAVTARLRVAGCVAADEEAAEMLDAAPDQETVEAWVRRREQGEPLAWIVGALTFCGHRVRVDPGVYVPRLQSEELARRAASLLVAGGRRAADLCTGAGAIAVHLMAVRPGVTMVGVDLDLTAAVCARRNGVPAVVGHLGEPLRPASFDVVTAVAPYVPTGALHLLPADVLAYEPVGALDGGRDGLDLVRQVIVAASRLLRPGGRLLIEVGGDQDQELRRPLAASGFGTGEAWADEDGDLRGLTVQYQG